ncbi:MAG: hypothetical protein HOL70_01740 [Candidatus Marinimicrobia bacterium]|jgi:hypothetical protein|nr:hypothetical protein [Candidatus Neomarinimicrobiota bacterium]
MRDGCSIEEVGKRLENAVMSSNHVPDDPSELYNRYEELAIQILDSEFMDWPKNILEQYLQVHLFCIQKELGLSHVA